MNENNRPKNPGEILDGLNHQANRMAFSAEEIKEKMNDFYTIQKQFIENGNLMTTQQNRFLNELKNYKIPNISLDPYAKKQLEELKEYEKTIRKKDRTVPYLVFIILLFLAMGFYFFNQGLKTKREIKEDLMREIYSKGDTVVNRNSFELSVKNIGIMNEWIKKNPKDSKKLVNFLDKKTDNSSKK